MERNDGSPYTIYQENGMRQALRYYFMTPCEKYRAKRRKPWKLLVQLLKIVVVTLQVCALGFQRSDYVDYLSKTDTALKHIMMLGWDSTYELLPYPAGIGRYAIYNTSRLVEHLNHAMTYYNKTPDIAIGTYGFPPDQHKLQSRTAKLEIVHFKLGDLHPDNSSYELNPQLVTDSVTFGPTQSPDGKDVYNVRASLQKHNLSLEVHKLHMMYLKFTLYAIHVKESKVLRLLNAPDCLHLDGKIVYDNSKHDGQLLLSLDLQAVSTKCSTSHYDKANSRDAGVNTGFDVFVLSMCILSTCICIRSIIKSLILLKETRDFFKKHYSYTLKRSEVAMFINFWYILIIISDVLTMIGTGFKMNVTLEKAKNYNTTCILLGLANILVWFGVLRYFEYFKEYNVLMLTLKRAAPDVLKFVLCAVVLYIAFTICGWVVLGPYHVKFKTLLSSSNCLFSLINGDDMFVTFSIVSEPRVPIEVYTFTHAYLYIFISLFIYFVLNIFVSVIVNTYETIKDYCVDGFPQTAIEKFINGGCEDSSSDIRSSYVAERSMSSKRSHCSAFSCSRSRLSDPLSETSSIINT